MDKTAFRKISYGLYIVSSVMDGRFNGQIANSLFQVSSDPRTVAVSINKENLTHEFIRASGVFSVSVLAETAPMTFIGLFGFKSGRAADKFEHTLHRTGTTGAPIVVEHCVAYFDVRVVTQTDCGTHTVFVGEAVDYDMISNAPPMTYAYYQTVMKGKSPKTAPSYLAEEKKPDAKLLERFTCDVCGYIYDPDAGDPDSGIPAGTPFEALPEIWTCPICGAGKGSFSKTP